MLFDYFCCASGNMILKNVEAPSRSQKLMCESEFKVSNTLKKITLLISTACVVIFGFSFNAAHAQNTSAEDRTGIPPAYQGPVSAVAAIVNDSVITTYDIQQRIKLMIISSGGRIQPELLPQLQQQALKDLVDEKLKLLEAKEFELEIEKEEIDLELQQIAAQGGVTPEQLAESLRVDGIAIETLRKQIEAGIAWPRLVQGRYGKRVRVSDDEIETTLRRMKEDASKEQFLVSEICIPVPSPDQAQTYYEGGIQLIEQMRQGVPFAVVAQQFSACTSAASGGDLGWVRSGELPPEIDEAIRALPTGAVTNPIPSEGAFMIMALRDKREAVAQGEKSWTLAYAGASLSLGRNAARQALEKLPAADACGTREQHADLGPGVGIALIENAKLGDIDPRFASAVEELKHGDLSPIIEADDALHAAYVCEFDEGLGIPARAVIQDRLYGRQLTRIANQYLRDVERKSMVDIRVRPNQPQPNG